MNLAITITGPGGELAADTVPIADDDGGTVTAAVIRWLEAEGIHLAHEDTIGLQIGTGFTAAIERNLQGLIGTNPGIATQSCDTCAEQQGQRFEEEPADEGSFKNRMDCDSCGTTLGGSVYAGHAFSATPSGVNGPGDVYHLELCFDCVLFHANGDEPEEWRARA